MRSKEHYEIIHKLHKNQGGLRYSLELFADHLGDREGYKGLEGMDNIYYYLCQKHNYLPAQVRDMPYEDLSLLLSQETKDWVIPKEFRFD
ncbi:hypothetical protein [Oceanospirillum maris]|uniref:hypothetical protein n=1 Tax=Oceanospirillum maris TaxID=64977 RepID=UPI000489560B|nr:hypothetical protein [Oceanospirillum maris]